MKPSEPHRSPTWKCPKCSEEIEDTFDSCWNCQTERPGQPQQPAADDDTADGAPFHGGPKVSTRSIGPEARGQTREPLHFTTRQIVTAQPPPNPEKPFSHALTRKQILAGLILGPIILTPIVIWVDSAGQHKASNESEQVGNERQEAEQKATPRVRIKEPKPVPRESAELYLKDATELAEELNSLLEMANSGGLTVEGIGKAEIWKGSVRAVLRQMKEDGFDIGPLNSATATGRVHAALESMQFAWESFGKFAEAGTERDRRTYSMMHATQLKFVRENLSDAAKWMDRGKF